MTYQQCLKIICKYDYRGFLYGFLTNVTYLVIKIIRLLSMKLNLVIIGFKDANEGDKLIFTTIGYKITILPFRRQSRFLLLKFITMSIMHE